jgi:hypothetical protein
MTANTANIASARAYQKASDDIDSLIQRLIELKQSHAERAASSPENWGYAGDLQALAVNLQRAVEAMGG